MADKLGSKEEEKIHADIYRGVIDRKEGRRRLNALRNLRSAVDEGAVSEKKARRELRGEGLLRRVFPKKD